MNFFAFLRIKSKGPPETTFPKALKRHFTWFVKPEYRVLHRATTPWLVLLLLWQLQLKKLASNMGFFKYLISYTEINKDHPKGRPGRSAFSDGETLAKAFSNLRSKANKSKGEKYVDLKLIKKFEKK